MINKTVKRWINEYLDGEIGLADKIELERIMSEKPEVRKEYMRLRKLGLLLGSMPEVSVHPSLFRQNLYRAMDQREAVFFTPQRAFSAAMLVAVIVIGLTFGLFMYQQNLIRQGYPAADNALVQSTAGNLSNSMAIDTGVSADQFFNRLLIECQLGMADQSLLSIFITEGVYDGAVCIPDGGLNSTRFATALPSTIRVQVLPHQVKALSGIAEGLAGFRPSLRVLRNDSPITVHEFLQVQPPAETVTLHLEFR